MVKYNYQYFKESEEFIMSLILKRFQFNSFQLKVLACLIMLIDHAGAVLFPKYVILRIIGRIAFPIFAWQLSIGFKKTQNVKKYIQRLAIFAFVAQVPFSLAFHTYNLNIFFTLLLSVIMLYHYEKNQKNNIVIVILISLLAQFLSTDYGAYGTVLVFLFYKYEDNFKKLLSSIVILNICYWVYIISMYISNGAGFKWRSGIQVLSIFSLLFIKSYNGEKGRKAKYLFYVFYPVHIIILYLIKRYIL